MLFAAPLHAVLLGQVLPGPAQRKSPSLFMLLPWRAFSSASRMNFLLTAMILRKLNPILKLTFTKHFVLQRCGYVDGVQ